jgi:hypothetical protein
MSGNGGSGIMDFLMGAVPSSYGHGGHGGGNNNAGLIQQWLAEQYQQADEQRALEQQQMQSQQIASSADGIFAGMILPDEILAGQKAMEAGRAMSAASAGGENGYGYVDPRYSPGYQAGMRAMHQALKSGNPLLQKAALANMGNIFTSTVPDAPAYRDPNARLTADIREYQVAQATDPEGMKNVSFVDYLKKVAQATHIVNPTSDMQNWAASGGEKGTGQKFNKWYQDKQNMAQERGYDAVVGKESAEEFVKIQQAPIALESKVANMQAIHQLLGDRGGFAGMTMGQLRSIADRIPGVDLTGVVSAQQAAEALSNKLTLDMRSTSDGSGMPGAMSDADREFLRNMSPNPDMTPKGRENYIRIHQALLDRRRQIAQAASDYVRDNGRLDHNFYNSKAYTGLRNEHMFDDMHKVLSEPNPSSAPPAYDRSSVEAELRRRGILK